MFQPLWIRPQPDYDPHAPRFWLIAGERLLRAAHDAHLTTVLVILRRVEERQVLILAELENNPTLRINLSPAEEARFAQQLIGACEGDRREAAKLLGWSAAKWDARRLLLHVTPTVLKVLTISVTPNASPDCRRPPRMAPSTESSAITSALPISKPASAALPWI